MPFEPQQAQVVGCMLGTAVGDALGLPYEGLSRRRCHKFLATPVRHRLLLGRGMVSDDTEHTSMVAQSLIASGGDLDAFRRDLGWRFRWWLLGLPAGIGMATLRAICRLWIGVSPERSGVYSAGNGPAMRSAILGATLPDREVLREFVRTSTRLTHTDPKAEFGAFAVALAARMASAREAVSPEFYLQELRSSLGYDADELFGLLEHAARSAGGGESTESFADAIGLQQGVSGYVYHSVPIAIHAWFRHPNDYQAAVTSVIRCGGDTDSTGAIIGGIVGASVGKQGIPTDWLDNICDWPRSVKWLERLAAQLGSTIQSPTEDPPLSLPAWGVLARNLTFLVVVLCHGFRRLLPPY